MAEFLARAMASERGFSLNFRSAGIRASDGQPASKEARELLAEMGLDLSGHQSRSLEGNEEADLILVMETSQRELLERKGLRVLLFSEWAGESAPGPDLEDPYGQDRAAYEVVFRRIREYLEKGFCRIEQG